MRKLWLFTSQDGRVLTAICGFMIALCVIVALLVWIFVGWAAAFPGFITAGAFLAFLAMIAVTRIPLNKLMAWIENGA